MLTVLAAGATSTGGGTDLLKWALDQGGAFLVALVCGYGWWRAERRADAERAARDLLAESIMEKFVPALEKSTAGTAEFVAVARQQQWQQNQHGRRDQEIEPRR